MWKLVALALASGGLSSPAAAQQGSLSLACSGVNSSAAYDGVQNNPTSEPAMVLFKLADNIASIKVPPGIATVKKNGGWLPVSELEVADTFIKGRISLSVFTKPRFEIDRNTGTMNFYSNNIGVGSSFSFTGTCQQYQETERKF